jgi:hypothetical protein
MNKTEDDFSEQSQFNLDNLIEDYNTYVENRLDSGLKVTLKHLADIKTSRDRNLTCSEIKNIIDANTSYSVLVDEDKPLYLYEVS